MAKVTAQLTDKEIKSAKAADKEYNRFDCGGLRLQVKPNSSKHWLLNYYRPNSKKQANLSLGKYADPSLTSSVNNLKKLMYLLLKVSPIKKIRNGNNKNTKPLINTLYSKPLKNGLKLNKVTLHLTMLLIYGVHLSYISYPTYQIDQLKTSLHL